MVPYSQSGVAARSVAIEVSCAARNDYKEDRNGGEGSELLYRDLSSFSFLWFRRTSQQTKKMLDSNADHWMKSWIGYKWAIIARWIGFFRPDHSMPGD